MKPLLPIKPIFSCILLLFGVQWQVVFADIQSQPESGILKHYQIQGVAQGTTYDINYFAEKQGPDQKVIDSLFQIIDQSMSLYSEGSLIRTFNRETTTHIEMDEHFQKVVEKSFEIYKLSDGRFDITVAPLVALWGFGAEKTIAEPDENAIKEALKWVGMDKITIDGNILRKCCPKVQIDLNGIAQGYTVDLIANYLEDEGIIHYLVELGGELRVSGKKHGEQPFRIGIESPDLQSHTVISPEQGALTSSGYLPIGAQHSHHIDPRTGYPFAKKAIRASVFANDAMTADAIDNLLVVMDIEDITNLLINIPGVEYLLYLPTENGQFKALMSPGFNQLIPQS